jgi:uncharacterized 2Fe-2S/4Fe-4S cluster protein (DUF4445 family)
MKHYRVTFKPDDRTISIHAGATIFEAAARAGIILNAVCGGAGTCGKCAVLLEDTGQKVLACQHCIQSDVVVIVPDEVRFAQQRILQTGIERKLEINPHVLKDIPHLDKDGAKFGIAVDIGTTTVAASLIDLADGTVRARAATENPQIACGDDVISRISYSETREGFDRLNDIIIECINSLTAQLCQKTGIDIDDIYELVAAGNTTMNHLFLKFPITQLGQLPYAAHSVDAVDRNAKEMGINIRPSGNIHTIENIASFIGSDTLAAALAVSMDGVEKMSLLVDIGTNGELVLGTKEKMYAASCAAGPALEGARIGQGSRASAGAIERVIMNDDDIGLDVIGGPPAKTICGSGLIDALAAILDLGLVDATGRLADADVVKGKVPDAILKRLIRRDGQGAFVLAANEDNDSDPVMLTQRDIREAQLAKAAIRAGIKLLAQEMGIEEADIGQIFLAGAFGNYIRRQSAVRIGLLPALDISRIHFVGNAAGAGARLILLSSHFRQLAGHLAEKIEHLETAHSSQFQMVFADSLMFDN